MNCRTLRTSIVCSLLVSACVAQSVPGPSVATLHRKKANSESVEKRLRVRMRDGIEAAKAGDTKRALAHFEAALGLDPTDPRLLRSLVDASRESPEAEALWARRLYLSKMDARGRLKIARNDKALVAALERTTANELAAARSAAVQELARFVAKLPHRGKKAAGNGLLARWAADVATELMRVSPALANAHAATFDSALARHEPDYVNVLKALTRVMQQSVKEDDTLGKDLQMRAARCLTGLGAQAAFKKLEGPKPPDVSRIRGRAQQARAKLRAKIASERGEPYSIASLRAMNAEEREAFTAKHAHWSTPAVGLSPTGLYVVETTCGHGTLLGALETVELHHRRLANWYGKDPFKARRGTIRIVPDHGGLEAEDSPFWWAGGFQRGDLTVVKFAWGSIAGLGRTLTHELTHRFDGVLSPSLPAWLTEGRAVWTGGAYGNADDAHFVDNYLNPYEMQAALVRGYGNGALLQRLLEGKIDDYRDNYPVGHALFVFLRSWQIDDNRVFEKRLRAYMRRIVAGRKDPQKFFVAHFADGKQGRPDGWPALLKEWNAFLGGCYKKAWNESVPWFDARYTRARTQPKRGARVLDRPTFTWTRNRAEPWFGQFHAAEAGRVLAASNHLDAATAALLWSLRTDGYDTSTAGLLQEKLDEKGLKDAAWALRYESSYRAPGSDALARAPFAARLPKLHGFVDRIARAADDASRAERKLIAHVLAGEERWLRKFLGGKSKSHRSDAVDLSFHLPHEAPTRLDLHGLDEDGLTGYEEKRARGLWFVDDDGNLHVGREKPREKTGVLDRSIHIRHAYVRSKTWQRPGRYVFRTRVHFTTSYVSGAILLGITRRDRNVRVSFTAGDYLYAIGRSNDVKKTDAIRLGTGGLWDREGGLGVTSRSRKVEFARPTTFFGLEVLVDGPSAWISIDGRLVHTYTTPQRTPIEGYIGAAMSSGAVRLQDPTVQRLDRGMQLDTSDGVGLSLRRPSDSVARVLGAKTEGIPVSPHGTVVLWIPSNEIDELDGMSERVGQRAIEKLIVNTLDHPQKWVFAVPKAWDSSRKDDLAIDILGYGDGRVKILEHESATPLSGVAWLLFVDASGVLRVAERVGPKGSRLATLRRWMRQYRNASRR